VIRDTSDFKVTAGNTSWLLHEVTWTMLDAGADIRGAAAVRDYVIALHAQMSDVHTRRIVVSDNAAYLEGDCVNARNEDAPRIACCVAYDVTGDRITAMRCYGTFGAIINQNSLLTGLKRGVR
jgi:SnoaL-like domain